MEQRPDRRTFPVHFAALGFLVESPMHGYELRQRLADGLGTLWGIASSQLYSVLHRLEDEGWIDSHVESSSSRPTRTVYEITPTGTRAFESWITSPVEHLRDVRVEFLAKIYFLRRLSPERIDAFVESQTRLLENLESRLSRSGRLEIDDVRLGEIAVSFRTQQIRSLIEWLKESQGALAETGNRT
jgi:PadR family transcriptional regulator AphA